MKLSSAIKLACLPLALAALIATGLLSCRADDAKSAKPKQSGPVSKTKDLTKMSKPELKKTLTPLQYHVTCENGTERAFTNEYWNNHELGLYVDVISGEPLFASMHKYESGTGWPSFFQPVKKDAIVEKADGDRVEVRGKKSGAHLGHVFPDGPKPTGMRYCMNSAALRFIPKDKLKEAGYEEYLKLFEAGKK